ncbi:hypothetical protein K435DRAFT_876561 [Dendrothele bispora CBS 962.96]|uniref:Uncharacterized protein n=1 Tax=Dendrothele bispora (strain CBS 962.96) TaxID=1314807 RepID=A0A4S8KS88_DENBC|nr:hypothetical protein K435DRAFT_876561 [Dendrothele bispora CBS 962.96]
MQPTNSSSRGLRLPPGIPHSPPILFDRTSGNTFNTESSNASHSFLLLPLVLSQVHLIPFFPLLGVLYTLTGHAILRATSSPPSPSDPNPYQTARLISSCQSGAVGGAILAIPLILLFYFIYAFLPSPSATVDRDSYSTSQYTTYTSPHVQSPDHLYRHGRTRQQGSRPDDFFDDSSSSSPINNFCCSPFFTTSTSTSTPTPTSPSLSSSSPLLTTLHYVAIFFTISMILTIGIGAASGSLGFTVLHAVKPESFVSSYSIPAMSASPTGVETETGNQTLMLSAVNVVKAGLIGAAVIGPVVLAVFWVIGRGVISVVFDGRKG